MSSGSTSSAASPATSGSAERLEVTIGTPAAIASSSGMPKPSSSEGNAKIDGARVPVGKLGAGDVAEDGDALAGRAALDAGPNRLGAVAE